MNTITCIVLAIIIPLVHLYSVPISITTSSSSSISNYYQDFASCSCDLTPQLCDNYCCCDSLCGSAATWSASNLCLATSSSIQIPCGQSTRGFGAIQDLACVYSSNRGTIGYYYQSPNSLSFTYPSTNSFSSIKSESAQSQQNTLAGTLTTGTSYTATNQYIKKSSSSYLFVPLPGPGDNCVPGLVNITTTGTFACKIIPTAQNCASLNEAYAGTSSICQKADCSTNSSSFTISASTLASPNCNNILTSFTLSNVLSYSSGAYTLQSTTAPSTTATSVLNTQIIVTVVITSTNANASSVRSGNPGYLSGKEIRHNISGILDSSGNCATSSSTLSVPFNTMKTITCLSPSPCSTSYYIDTLANLTLTISKYASQSEEVVTVSKNIKYGCKAQGYTINILYSMNGWMLDPQYYILSAYMTDTATPDGSNPTSKYLRFNWIYVDPASVSSQPENNFYTYFSYLWTPLKQKFGLAS